MSRYTFDTDKLASLIPTSMRGDRTLRLVRCILAPVKALYLEYTAYREDTEYRLDHTGQVASLEEVIRSYCDDDRCYISDGEYVSDILIPYDESEELSHYQVGLPYDGDVTPPVAIPYKGLGQVAQNDFIVHLPRHAEDYINTSGLKALINLFKTAGKSYTIVFDIV